MTVVEKVTYKPCSDNPQWTVAERKAWIDSKIFGLGYAIQVRFFRAVCKSNFLCVIPSDSARVLMLLNESNYQFMPEW